MSYNKIRICYIKESIKEGVQMKKLIECLEIKSGVTTFVGGGGKTSSIFQVAKELQAQKKRVIVTTTTKMYYPAKEQAQIVLIDPKEEQIREALTQDYMIAVGGNQQESKITGVSDTQIGMMERLAEYVLVEGDGAKHLPIKVPAEHEPVIPKSSQKVIIVVGMKALNTPLEVCCFRQDKAMDILDVEASHTMSQSDMIIIITNREGLQKGIGDKEQAVLINQIDVIDGATLDHFAQCLKEKYKETIVFAALQQGIWKQV